MKIEIEFLGLFSNSFDRNLGLFQLEVQNKITVQPLLKGQSRFRGGKTSFFLKIFFFNHT